MTMKGFDANEFAKKAHALSVAHGFYDTEEDKRLETKLALIHCELSEALDQYVRDMPDVYCQDERCERFQSDGCDGCADACGFLGGSAKPEGVMIELADACIRIMDMMAWQNMQICDIALGKGDVATAPIQKLVLMIHQRLSEVFFTIHPERGGWIDKDRARQMLNWCLRAMFYWAAAHGQDMGKLIQLKHRYNQGRSYKHGKKI